MAPLTKKLFYNNDDKWIEKLFEILLAISEDKWIKHLFDVEGGISRISRQEVPIKSQNVVNCVKFLVGHPNI